MAKFKKGGARSGGAVQATRSARTGNRAKAKNQPKDKGRKSKGGSGGGSA